MSDASTTNRTAPAIRARIDRADLAPYAGVVACYALTILLGLALADDAARAGLVAFEDPGDLGNVGSFAVAALAGTAVMLALFRYDRGLAALRLGLVATFSNLTAAAFVLATGVGGIATSVPLVAVAPATPVPIAVAAGTATLLWFYPEWYVVNAVGIVAGGATIAMLGLGLAPFPILVLLVAWAAYDAYAVYVSGHMKALASGGIDLKVPILFVVPTRRGYSFLDGDDSGVGSGHGNSEVHGDDGPTDAGEEASDPGAMMLGLGDALIPGLLAVSAGRFLEVSAVLPVLNANLPAVGAAIGGLVGMGALLVLASRVEGKHAGLPPLNAGVIAGYLAGALAAGVPLVVAVGP